jgi:hypothetical protein
MATRSCIAVEHCNGAVSEIYCHSDGYLEGVGETLLLFYNTTALVSNLVKLGDISSLGEHAQKGSTFAYMRDKGEVNCEARLHSSVENFKLQFNDSTNRLAYGYEYMYLLTRKHGWEVKIHDREWERLTTALVTEKLIND